MGKRIVLLNPNRSPSVIGLSAEEMDNFLMTASPIETFTASSDTPTSEAYMAPLLRARGHEVKIIDAHTRSLSNEGLLSELKEFAPEWVLISSAPLGLWRCFPLTTKHVLNAVRVVKNYGKSKIVLSGPHGTIYPSAFKEHFDVVIKGEPEEVFGRIVESKNLREVAGISFWEEKEFVENFGVCHVGIFDALPIPAYEDILIKERDEIGIFASRGCPFQCSFCCKAMPGMIYRMRSAKKVVDEIELLAKKFKMKRVYFSDESFTLIKEFVLEICEELKKRKLSVEWGIETRAEFISEELARAMKSAGCFRVDIGMETADAELLKKINKGNKVEDIERAVKILKANGIEARLFTIIGLPGENEKTINNTLAFLARTAPHDIGSLLATPYPGTALFAQGIEEGKIDERWIFEHKWEKLGVLSGQIGTTFRKQEAREHVKNFRLKYYLQKAHLLALYPLFKALPLVSVYTPLRKLKAIISGLRR
ncbi:MAG: radical SAM protein [Candidatus Micrarchaeota archaeon]